MTLLIKNVQVLGAPHPLPPKTDIFISGDKISAFGSFPERGADEVIDGQGAYASAGFIDIHTSSDHYLTLFDDPSQQDFLKQGVTTIVGGNCGSSLAPLLYGTLESIRKWADTDKVNVNWHTMKEFLDTLEKRPLGINFATLVGHSTIRRSISGDAARALTKNEMNVFAETLKRAIREGGFGLSTGLGYVHGKQTPYAEIKNLADVVKKHGGMYATHLRKGGSELGDSIDETLKIYKDTGVSTLISHFVPKTGEGQAYEAALEKFDVLPADADFHFDLYPFPVTVMPLYTFLPEWAQKENLETMVASLEDEWQRAKILKEMPMVAASDFRVAQATRNDSLVGRSLKDLQELYETKNTSEAIVKLMRMTKLRAVVFYRNISERLIRAGLSHPRSLIASNAASIPDYPRERVLKPERATATFTKFLSLVEKENLMPLEQAIRKITLAPAKKLGLKGRGELREGNFADITMFRNGEIKSVVVNGKVAMQNGILENVSAGRALRHA